MSLASFGTQRSASYVGDGSARPDFTAFDDLSPGRFVDHRVEVEPRPRVRDLGAIDAERYSQCLAAAEAACADLI